MTAINAGNGTIVGEWNAREVLDDVRGDLGVALMRGAGVMVSRIKKRIRLPGPKRTAGRKLRASYGDAKAMLRARASKPGEPPRFRTGNLFRSISAERSDQGATPVVLVGSNLPYSLYLEKGTRKMEARPYIESTFKLHKDEIIAAIVGTMSKRTEARA